MNQILYEKLLELFVMDSIIINPPLPLTDEEIAEFETKANELREVLLEQPEVQAKIKQVCPAP